MPIKPNDEQKPNNNNEKPNDENTKSVSEEKKGNTKRQPINSSEAEVPNNLNNLNNLSDLLLLDRLNGNHRAAGPADGKTATYCKEQPKGDDNNNNNDKGEIKMSQPPFALLLPPVDHMFPFFTTDDMNERARKTLAYKGEYTARNSHFIYNAPTETFFTKKDPNDGNDNSTCGVLLSSDLNSDDYPSCKNDIVANAA